MVEIDNLKIEKNECNDGLCAVFEWEGQEYFADLCVVPCVNFTECMIFPSKDGVVTSWGGLYCRRDIPVTKEQLKESIKEFINNKKIEIMKKQLFKIDFVSYHKWNDFGFNLLPNIYFMREDDEDGLCRTFGIGWLCWSIEFIW